MSRWNSGEFDYTLNLFFDSSDRATTIQNHPWQVGPGASPTTGTPLFTSGNSLLIALYDTNSSPQASKYTISSAQARISTGNNPQFSAPPFSAPRNGVQTLGTSILEGNGYSTPVKLARLKNPIAPGDEETYCYFPFAAILMPTIQSGTATYNLGLQFTLDKPKSGSVTYNLPDPEMDVGPP